MSESVAYFVVFKPPKGLIPAKNENWCSKYASAGEPTVVMGDLTIMKHYESLFCFYTTAKSPVDATLKAKNILVEHGVGAAKIVLIEQSDTAGFTTILREGN